MKSHPLFKNSFWYAFGAASSMLAGVGVEENINPNVGRLNLDLLGSLFIFGASFALAWIGYLASRVILIFTDRFSENFCSHFIPLILGFTYCPIVLLTKDFMPESEIASLMKLVTPPLASILAMGLILPSQRKPEQDDTDNPVNAPENPKNQLND